MRAKFKWSILLLHIMFWLLVSIVPISLIMAEDINVRPKYSQLRFFAGPILFYLNYSFLVPRLLLKKKILLYALLSIAILVVYNYLAIHLISPPPPPFENIPNINDMKEHLPKPKGMMFALPVAFSLSIFLFGGVFALIIGFYEKDRNAKQFENERKEIELQFLRTQLNPHFLFNTLNSIYSLVRSKSDDAPEALITLSELMRYMLYEVTDSKVLLDKELNYLKNYMSLQRLRLLNSEDVKLQIHGDAKQLKIYPLILITFIENAFKYGTDYKGNTKISITINITDNSLVMHLDNIIGTHKKDQTNSGVGLKNVNNQLNYFYMPF